MQLQNTNDLYVMAADDWIHICYFLDLLPVSIPSRSQQGYYVQDFIKTIWCIQNLPNSFKLSIISLEERYPMLFGAIHHVDSITQRHFVNASNSTLQGRIFESLWDWNGWMRHKKMTNVHKKLLSLYGNQKAGETSSPTHILELKLETYSIVVVNENRLIVLIQTNKRISQYQSSCIKLLTNMIRQDINKRERRQLPFWQNQQASWKGSYYSLKLLLGWAA